MTTVLPHTLVAGTAENVNHVQANFETVRDDLNTLEGEVDAHIADTSGAHAASAISYTAGGTVAATNVQDAIAEVASEVAGGVLERQVSTTAVAENTTSESTLFTYTVGAGVLSTNRAVRLTLFGDYLNDSGSNKTVTVKVKFGATTMYQDVTGAITAANVRREIRLDLLLANQSASDQYMQARWVLGEAQAPTTGRGKLTVQQIDDTLAASDAGYGLISGDAAEDSSAAKALAVTVQHSAAHTSVVLRRHYAVLELI